MKPQRIKLTKSQVIDGEFTTTETVGIGRLLAEDGNVIRFESDTEDIVLTFTLSGIAMTIYGTDGSILARMALSDRSETQSPAVTGQEFFFRLNSVFHDGLNVFLQYDTYYHGGIIAENSLKTEVIEA